MKCEAIGTITAVLSCIGGVRRDGKDWEKRSYVMQTNDMRPTYVMFSMYSFDGPIQKRLEIGDKVKILFTVEAHEYKGNWYNEVKVYRVDKPEG